MTSYLPGRPFSHDGNKIYEVVNEQQFRKINGMVETSSREMRGKKSSAMQVANLCLDFSTK